MGIWPTYSDGTDVNACEMSPSGRYMLTADDFGKVKLFNYPVVVQHAPALVYGGHSSFVPNVRWAYDESFACSVGGRDRCTFQFRIVQDQAPSPVKVGRDEPGKYWCCYTRWRLVVLLHFELLHSPTDQLYPPH